MAFTGLRGLSAISILLLFLSCRDTGKLKYYNISELSLKNKNGLAMNHHSPFTGAVYSFFPNTKDTAEIIGFNKGREHGEWKQFFPGGKLRQQRYYENGVKVKTLKEWWDNGKLKISGSFLKGENHGVYKEWNREGRLVQEMHYKSGYEEGSQKQFYDNGKIRSNYVMKNGKRYGLLGTKNCVNVKDSIFKK
ncbi:antitoxin component YwqK of YwqJK toxin-antitoxin module [Chryseobacterium defluvii]|uniref:Antitoxin component YwqK of YwqJK toxin-antitoxin module n=1 Tax=Chryseobacterium defluvii TaxID=160396 RepID=A0A840K7K5_9FLAO|nr:toxin-antitoxin system YwqK family antitoxin [Chryseobacterium defluvii]MBB4805209.1 antitoxin component YwqK of YwqJK toxin-antitoxin module [Chryseobacterium defluvii]